MCLHFMLRLDRLTSLKHVLADLLRHLIKRNLLVETFGKISHTVHRNQVLAAEVLGQLLETSDALVVKELCHLALLEGGQLLVPVVLLRKVVVEAWACVMGALEFIESP